MSKVLASFYKSSWGALLNDISNSHIYLTDAQEDEGISHEFKYYAAFRTDVNKLRCLDSTTNTYVWESYLQYCNVDDSQYIYYQYSSATPVKKTAPIGEKVVFKAIWI